MYIGKDALKHAIDAHLEELDQQEPEELRYQQVNARIDTDAYYMLTKLAGRFQMSRSGAPGFLLEHAIQQAWAQSGMPVVKDGIPAFHNPDHELYNDYRKWMWEQLRVSINGYADEVALTGEVPA